MSNMCTIKISKGQHNPLIWSPEHEGYLFYPYEKDNHGQTVYRVPSDIPIRMSCSGRHNGLVDKPEFKTRRIDCCDSLLMSTPTGSYTVIPLGCKRRPKPSVLTTREKEDGTRIHDIGFRFNKDYAKVLYSTKINTTTLGTLSVTHNFNTEAYFQYKEMDPSRPKFKFFHKVFGNFKPKKLYFSSNMRQQISKVLGPEKAKKYRYEMAFVRGHLAPDSDFVLLAEQDATFYLSNAIPQVQWLNNGPWKDAENYIRIKSKKLSCKVTRIETGVDPSGGEPVWYLDSAHKKIPVPPKIYKSAFCDGQMMFETRLDNALDL